MSGLMGGYPLGHFIDIPEPSPLWCARNEPHGEHWRHNEFGGRDYCSGRPTPNQQFCSSPEGETR